MPVFESGLQNWGNLTSPQYWNAGHPGTKGQLPATRGTPASFGRHHDIWVPPSLVCQKTLLFSLLGP
eukprot:2852478-Rhodomonas_salina.2